MSASEKLKELTAEFPHDMGEFDFRVQPLRDALPQIVAVVEAAESVTFYGQEAYRYNEWAGSRIVLALTALEEALS